MHVLEDAGVYKCTEEGRRSVPEICRDAWCLIHHGGYHAGIKIQGTFLCIRNHGKDSHRNAPCIFIPTFSHVIIIRHRKCVYITCYWQLIVDGFVSDRFGRP